MTKTDMPELLPCPFCGGKADMRRDPCPDGGGYFAFIQCRNCRAKGADTYYSTGNDCPQTYQGRRDDWNARAIAFDVDLIEQAISDVIAHDGGSIRAAAEYVYRSLTHTSIADAQLAEAEARGRRKALEEAARAIDQQGDAFSGSWVRAVYEHAASKIRALSDAPAREVTVQKAAQVLLDDSERIGCQRSPDPELDWKAAYVAMGEDFKECGWNDWPSILDAALRALAQGGQDDG